MPAKRAGEGRARIVALILGDTLTLPTLRVGPFPLPGRERGRKRTPTPYRTQRMTPLSNGVQAPMVTPAARRALPVHSLQVSTGL
ncbi:hypothetical protein D3867_18650 (plasmid) [Azospirillum argentinense]|uniref:Uncharacterized protein n=1 Tax=Azospirillum brasilense TaxID=192 RepID=A0A4D8Q1K8_AZOBR|nr:hypothetical protein D3867_18650 [Azospirillum argentinense]